MGVLAVAEGLVGAKNYRLDVAEGGVDPLGLRRIPRRALADHLDDMNVVGVREAFRAVTERDATFGQVRRGRFRGGLTGEASYSGDLQVRRVALLVERFGCDERDLFIRTSAKLVARLRVLCLRHVRQTMLGFVRSHGHQELVVHQLGRRVTHSGVALEFRCRNDGHGLADQVAGQKSLGQGRLGVWGNVPTVSEVWW